MTPQRIQARLLKGSGAQGLALLVRTGEQLLVVPILLAAWSPELFGEWLILSAIPIYLALSDLGFITAGSNELARRAEGGITPRVRQFFRGYVCWVRGWSALLLALACLGVAVVPVAGVFGLTRFDNATAASVFILLTGTALLAQNGLSLIAGLRAARAFHLGLLVRALFSLLGLAALAALVLGFGAGPVAAALGLLLCRAGELVVLAALLKSRDLAAGWRLVAAPVAPFRRLLGPGLAYMLFPAAQALVLQGMILLVGTSQGALAAAAFATHRTLARATAQLVQLGVGPLRAELGLCRAESMRPLVRDIITRAAALAFWASLALAAGLAVAGGTIFAAWTHGAVTFSLPLLALLLAAGLLDGLWRITASYRLGSNAHRPLARGYFVLSLSGLALAWLALEPFGLRGAAAAAVLVEAGMLALAIRCNRQVPGLPPGAFLAAMLRFPAADLGLLLRLLRRRGRP